MLRYPFRIRFAPWEDKDQIDRIITGALVSWWCGKKETPRVNAVDSCPSWAIFESIQSKFMFPAPSALHRLLLDRPPRNLFHPLEAIRLGQALPTRISQQLHLFQSMTELRANGSITVEALETVGSLSLQVHSLKGAFWWTSRCY